MSTVHRDSNIHENRAQIEAKHAKKAASEAAYYSSAKQYVHEV